MFGNNGGCGISLSIALFSSSLQEPSGTVGLHRIPFALWLGTHNLLPSRTGSLRAGAAREEGCLPQNSQKCLKK